MSATSKNERPNLATRWTDTPIDILEVIQTAESAVKELKRIGKEAGIDRQFTLDGRLVGDIGELVIARHFRILPDKDKLLGHAHDLYGLVNGRKVGVQVKLRCKATGQVGFKYQPEVLVVLEFKKDDWSKWRIVFNGSGKVVTRNGITVGADRRLKQGSETKNVGLTLDQLEAAHRSGRYARLALKRKSRISPSAENSKVKRR